MKILHKSTIEEIRKGRIEYGEIEATTNKKKAICRCCATAMPKETEVLKFAYDFNGCGSWTAQVVMIHKKTCNPINTTGGSWTEIKERLHE